MLEIIKKLPALLKKITGVVATDGKSLLVWILNEWPGLTDYPGLLEALKKFLENPNKVNLTHVLFQALWALAAGHRLIKVLAKVIKK